MIARLHLSRVLAAAACTIALQARAQQAIPVRMLTPPITTDSGVLGRASAIRAMTNGAVIINDLVKRQLIMLDSSLKKATVLADTTGNAPNKYSTQRNMLILPYLGDSSVAVDLEAQAMIVVSPTGKFGRVMAPPKASDLPLLGALNTSIDSRGRFVYRSNRPVQGGGRPAPGAGAAADGSGKPTFIERPDSAPIVRSDFETRTVDTIAMLKIPVGKQVQYSPRPQATITTAALNPLPQTDEWAMLPDGTIAIVRAQDYHIDWVGADGKITSSPKMPFDWKKISPEEKQALLDSVKKAAELRNAAPPPGAPPAGTGAGTGAGAAGAGGAGPGRTGGAGPGGAPGPGGSGFRVFTVEASDLPDYYPPVRQGQVKADQDGNVWILPSTSTLSQGNVFDAASAATSSLVYDVVGRDGVIKERVKLPPGRTLIGFGPGGVVFMNYAIAPNNLRFERARIAR